MCRVIAIYSRLGSGGVRTLSIYTFSIAVASACANIVDLTLNFVPLFCDASFIVSLCVGIAFMKVLACCRSRSL